jgi:hypothetical protein
VDLTLNEAERELLLEILHSRMSELRGEVYHTTVSDYRDMLKAKEAMLHELLTRLGEAPAEGPASESSGST